MSLNTNIGPERVQVLPQAIGTVPVQGIATAVTAFLISTSQGGAPLQVATPCTSLKGFTNLFGFADEAGQGYYAVEDFFANGGEGNTAIIVNVGATPTASDYIGNASLGTGLRALDGQDILGLVTAPGLTIDMAYLVQPALIDYTKTVRADFGATLSTSFSLAAVPQEVTTAANDVILHANEVISAITGNVLTLGLAVFPDVKAGMVVHKAGVFKTVITAVNSAAHQITVLSVSGLATSDNIDLCVPSAVTWVSQVINDPSKASAWYFNWLVQNNESLLTSPPPTVTVDPCGAVAGTMARIDANTTIGGVSHAPAGIQYAGLAGIIGLQLSLSERIDAEPLRLAFINRITSFPGSGNVIFGAYSGAGSAATADDQLIQVIRSVQFIKGSLERGLRGFIWENFSPVTQSRVEGAIDSFLSANNYLFPAGLPQNQKYKVIHVIATSSDEDAGLLTVRVQIKPNKAVRFIEIDLEYPLPTA